MADVRPGDGLRAVAVAVAQGWRTVAATVLLSVTVALAGLWSVEPHYTAVLVIGPTARSGMAGMGARLPGWLSGLAEPGATDETLSDFTRFLHLLTSVPVAQALMEEPGMLPRLFPNRWDAGTGTWHPPGGITGMIRSALLTLSGRDEAAEPDPGMVAAWLRAALVVEPVGTTPMRRLRLRHSDRAFALALLTRLAALSDAHLRGETQRLSEARIAYFTGIVAVPLEDQAVRASFSDMLADQKRVLTLLKAGQPFAADIIEPATAPPRPDWPDPTVVLPASLAAGVMLGIGLATARASWRQRTVQTRGADDG